ncbi:MAG: PBP1A family penicillin-binding protein [Nitrospinae bacterium]|nr:PBP1A family penicillin-binding protein [Nitrospinota bacterium]
MTRFRPLLEKFYFFLYGVFLLAVVSGLGVYFVLSKDLPQLPENLANINLSLPTEIYSSDGERIKVLGERRPVSIEDISPHFLNAIISVEDSNFYDHQGLDHIGLVRAVYMNFRAKRVVQGGSTITQQLSKNLFFSFERNFVRKIKELLIALQLEATFTKEQILEAYSNQIYFGSGAYGVEEAADVYFGKRAQDLTLLQAALLAGLPNSPNNTNPFYNLDRALSRAGFVLKRMWKEGFITADEKVQALLSSLDLLAPKSYSNPNLYFVDFVIRKLEKDYGKEFVHFGGLKIYTTLDSRQQLLAKKAAISHLEALEAEMSKRESKEPLQVALVCVENKSGAVRAMMGGKSYSHSQFNRAISNNRLPGSSFKPFVYLTAMMELGYSPATVVRDEPVIIDIPGGQPWEPKNFGKVFAGDIILKKALMKSLNVISAKLMQAVGPEKVIETARRFGIKSPLGKNYSLALGTSGISPLEMASAYSVIANLGIYNEPYFIEKIEDFHGNQLYEHFYQGIQRFPQKVIYPLLDMMKGVVDAGTARGVRRMGFRHPAAGKTGTTNDFKDAWFNGVTKDFAVSVWVGYDNNEPMLDKRGRGLTGGRAAAPIWVFFLQKVLQGKNKVKFPVPTGIKFETVDVRTGRLADELSLETMSVAVKEELDLSPLPEIPELPEMP